MALQQLPPYQDRYFGLSADRKPPLTAGSEPPLGSLFVETDTGNAFRWDGDRWAPLESDPTTALLTTLVIGQRRANELLEILVAAVTERAN